MKLTNKARSQLLYDIVHGIDDEGLAERYSVSERQIRYYRHNYKELISKMSQRIDSTESDIEAELEPESDDDLVNDESEDFVCAECAQQIEYLQQFCSGCGVKLAWQ